LFGKEVKKGFLEKNLYTRMISLNILKTISRTIVAEDYKKNALR
jgi:hypothetical protein